jgi:hypothetical protein
VIHEQNEALGSVLIGVGLAKAMQGESDHSETLHVLQLALHT